MIISNSGRYIYVHIPKCGGTTVSGFLERFMGPQDVTLNLNPHAGWDKYLDAYQKKFGLFKHSTAAEIARAMGKEAFCGYEVFTFCRNPFARAYSAFTFTLKADALYRPDSERHQAMKSMSFEDFLASPYAQDQAMLPTRPQSHWVEGAPVAVRAYKLENVDRALPWIARKNHRLETMPTGVKRTNFSADKDAWRGMSEAAEEMIRTLYAEDFKRFGYADRLDRTSQADGSA